MNNRRRGTENLSDADHEDMLNNDAADLRSKIVTYHEYVEMGIEPDVALKMSGLKKDDFEM